MNMQQDKVQEAFDKIHTLGGHVVCEPDCIVVSLDNTAVTDRDLSLLEDFNTVQFLSISNTAITDKSIKYLLGLPNLETLVLVNPAISEDGINKLIENHEGVDIQTEPLSTDTINPFTGEPFGS